MDGGDDKKSMLFGRRKSRQDASGLLFSPPFECPEFRLHSFASEVLTVKICCRFRVSTMIESCFRLNGDTNDCAAIELERRPGLKGEETQH